MIAYQINPHTFRDRDEIIQRFLGWDFLPDNLHVLDNGIVIFCGDRFSEKPVISKFTCGLGLCYQVSSAYEYFLGKNELFEFLPMAGDDFHSGWDWDYMLKFYFSENLVKVEHEFDSGKRLAHFEKRYFFQCYFHLCDNVFDWFTAIYPEIKSMKEFREIEYHCVGKNALRRDFGR